MSSRDARLRDLWGCRDFGFWGFGDAKAAGRMFGGQRGKRGMCGRGRGDRGTCGRGRGGIGARRDARLKRSQRLSQVGG
jgi:hypothetical protein